MRIADRKLALSRVVATAQIGIGAGFGLFFGLPILVFINPDYETNSSKIILLLICVLFVVGSICLIIHGIKQNRLILLCKNYATILSDGSVNRIDQLARITGQSSDFVRTALTKMIRLGYLENIYVNHTSGEITICSGRDMRSVGKTVSVTCKACGGVTDLAEGAPRVCAYCGSPIQGT